MAEPVFNPNKPFNVVSQQSGDNAQAPVFNPNKPFTVVPDRKFSNDVKQQESPVGIRALQAFGESLPGQALGAIGETVDRYTGAPTRAAIGAMQEGSSPLSAFVSQFGADPNLAPTGKDIAFKAGLSKEETVSVPGFGKVSPAGIAGILVDVAADPTNIIPGNVIAKQAAKGVKKLGEYAIKGSAAAADVLTGSKAASKTVQVASGVAEDAVKAINDVINPKQAPDKDYFFNIAKKNGIDPNILPESVEFGKESVIARAARKRNEGTLGQKYREQHLQSVESIKNATNRRVENIAKGPIPATPGEAGNIIRKGIDKTLENVFNESNITYQKIAKENPGLKLSDDALLNLDKKLDGLESRMKTQMKSAYTQERRAQAKTVMNGIERIRNSKGDFQTVVDQLQEIGRASFKQEKGIIPLDKASARQLYGDLSSAIVESTRVKFGDELADNLLSTNEIISGFYGDKNPISRFIDDPKIPPEKLFDSLLKNGDTTRIKALKAIVPPEEFSALKGAYIKSIASEVYNGELSFNRLNKNINRNIDKVKEILTPQEIVDLKELASLGERLGPIDLTTSGPRDAKAFNFGLQDVIDATTARTGLEQLKERARAAGAKETLIKKIETSAKTNNTEQLKQAFKEIKKLNKTRTEKGLKGAQIYSTTNKEE